MILQRALILSFLLVLVSCGDKERSSSAGGEEEVVDLTWQNGDKRYTIVARVRDGALAMAQIKVAQDILREAGIPSDYMGSMSVISFSVPVEDEDRAKKLLVGISDENGFLTATK